MKEIIVSVVVVLIFVTLYLLLYNITILSETKIEKKSYTEEFQLIEEPYINKTSATTIKVPAVDREGRGVMATLSVEANPGVGRTLVDINQIFFWVDTQDSIRTAKAVSKDITDIDLSNYDIVYSIQANASVIEGPSAGAAMAIATIIELENRTIREGVTITGTINEDGVVGQVSGIVAKGEAARENGMDIFLVPSGQKMYTTFIEDKKCESYVFTTICRTEVKPETVDVENQVGIEVEEVKNLQEALKYFLD
jgi:uncharacterized protein